MQASTISQILKGRVYSLSGRVRDKSEKRGEPAREREKNIVKGTGSNLFHDRLCNFRP